MLANKIMHKILLGDTAKHAARGLAKPYYWSGASRLTEMSQQPVRSFATDNHAKQVHPFSSMATMTPGTIEKPLQVLDMSMVRKIKAELMEVDANSDGRYGMMYLK